MKFTPEQLEDIFEDDEKIVFSEVVGTLRWHRVVNIVFSHEDKFYQTHYLQGLTENHDNKYPYQDCESQPIECPRVEKATKMVEKEYWERVEE